ncbi:MAG: DUF2318 domain-containing protein [Lachnospiraceae bacterium]|nr:DUF2318 domain-containing protein [Lachnospiraceae bacterium]
MSGKKTNPKNKSAKNNVAKQSDERTSNAKNIENKNRSRILPVIAGVVVVAAVAAVAVTRFAGNGNGEEQSVSNSSTSDAQTADYQSTGTIVIDTDEIGETASYYDYDADGTTVEVLAVTASDGSVRLALNTCQVCQGSPYAYFVQEGDSFICQNCGNVFSRDDIGLEAGGCNPVPVTEEYYEESDGVITISSDFLDGYKESFTNWKKA